MEKSQEFLKRELMHFLGDTIALLGAEESFVKRVKEFEEKPFTSQFVDEVRNYTAKLSDQVKNRLSLCNTMQISVDKSGN